MIAGFKFADPEAFGILAWVHNQHASIGIQLVRFLEFRCDVDELHSHDFERLDVARNLCPLQLNGKFVAWFTFGQLASDFVFR